MDVGTDPKGCRSLEDTLASGAAPEEPTAAEAVQILNGLLVRGPAPRASCGAAGPARALAAASAAEGCAAAWH